MKNIAFCILLALCSTICFAQNKNLIVNLNFNTGDVTKVAHRDFFDTNAQHVSDSVLYKGEKSVRFEVKSSNPGDKGIRSEFAFASESNSERWYTLSIYPPSTYLPDPEPEIVTQWHNVPDVNLGEQSLSPSLGLFVQNGHWNVHVLWDTARVTKQGHWMGSIGTDLGPVSLNTWTTWVFHIRFSYKNDGLVQIYKNGVKVYERKGPNDFNDAALPYWKVGIYKWVYRDHNPADHKRNQRVLFYSHIKEGDEKSTYNDFK